MLNHAQHECLDQVVCAWAAARRDLNAQEDNFQENSRRQMCTPRLDLNGVLGSSSAVFVLVSFCIRGETKTERRKTKTKRKRKTSFRTSPASMLPRGSKTAQRRLMVTRKLLNSAPESQIHRTWGPADLTPRGFLVFVAQWSGPRCVARREGRPSMHQGSALVACTTEPVLATPLFRSVPPPVHGRIQRSARRVEEARKTPCTSRGSQD